MHCDSSLTARNSRTYLSLPTISAGNGSSLAGSSLGHARRAASSLGVLLVRALRWAGVPVRRDGSRRWSTVVVPFAWVLLRRVVRLVRVRRVLAGRRSPFIVVAPRVRGRVRGRSWITRVSLQRW